MLMKRVKKRRGMAYLLLAGSSSSLWICYNKEKEVYDEFEKDYS